MQDPQGPVTNAVCALASLHYTQMRIAQGLEAPDPNLDRSNARYFQGESYFQLASAKQLRGYNESDAIAALHLICYAQLSGGTTDWQPVLTIACDWLTQTGLPKDDNPKLTYRNMSPTAKLAVRATLVSSSQSHHGHQALTATLVDGDGREYVDQSGTQVHGIVPTDDFEDVRVGVLGGAPGRRCRHGARMRYSQWLPRRRGIWLG